MKALQRPQLAGLSFFALCLTLRGDPLPTPTIQVLTNRETLITSPALPGVNLRLDAAVDVQSWAGLAFMGSNNPSSYIDSGAPYRSERFYRTVQLAEASPLLGDIVPTDSGNLVIHPVNHASFVMSWNGKIIYFDPVGGASRFQGLPRADVILVTHAHTDHFDAPTINAVKATNAVLLVPPVVNQSLPATLKAIATVLTNGSTAVLPDFSLDVIPAYNLTSSYHPKGVGNGYVLTLGGRRIYVSGDTEDTPELRALQNIDVAFVCMNLPYTMSVDKAASAVRAFKPSVVYVYHYQGYSTADVNRFKASVGTDLGIEVRLRKWY
jgi:L-ascorbate metabolism protein UlaG (beta-lactamase superfamily)